MKHQRVIARYKGHARGPLLLVLGGIHGNEKAGVKAVKIVKKMLDVEPMTNPNFRYRGNFIGLLGNVEAGRQKVRFIDRDLNRLWTKEYMKAAYAHDIRTNSIHELRELRMLYTAIVEQVDRYNPDKVIILDLHTTSSDGGIFTIPSTTAESIRIAACMHAPVIHDMLTGIEGTTLHFFQDLEINNVPVTSVTFEAGQHKDPKAVNLCVAAILSTMRAISAVETEDIESIHDQILISYGASLPGKCRLVYKHSIKEGDGFEMKAGYTNFQRVQRGEIVALDHNGPIQVKTDGYMLMPLYQDKGNDGFFIIEDVA